MVIGDLAGGRLRCHPLLIQNGGPATGCFRQGHYRRKLPAKGDRFLAFWQIMYVLCRPIGRGDGFRTGNTAGIYSDPLPLARIWLGQVVGKDFRAGRFSLMRPSSNASYKLDHLRSNHGDCETSGNDLACVSVISASTVLNRASFARGKQS